MHTGPVLYLMYVFIYRSFTFLQGAEKCDLVQRTTDQRNHTGRNADSGRHPHDTVQYDEDEGEWSGEMWG